MPETWHYGLVADWWAEFYTDGAEIDYFGRFVERGQPALDAGCGTGRLLLPWLRAGFDVDGCDVSADMVDRCREKALHEGFHPTLFVQPLHLLDPPRRYRTIIACGVFGLGSTRAEDQEALRRFHRWLEPGGTLALDNEVPYAYAKRWPLWTKKQRLGLPEPWPTQGDRRRARDGSEHELRTRAIDLDPLDQSLTLEIRADRWLGETHAGRDERTISIRMYFRDELLLMLQQAGFASTVVRGDYTDEEANGDNDFLVLIARR